MPQYTFSPVKGIKRNGRLALICPDDLLAKLFVEATDDEGNTGLFLKMRDGKPGRPISDFEDAHKNVYLDTDAAETVLRKVEDANVDLEIVAEVVLRGDIQLATDDKGSPILNRQGKQIVTISATLTKLVKMEVMDAAALGFIEKETVWAPRAETSNTEAAPAGVTAAGAASSFLAGRMRR